jgi:tellurite resistance protein TerC
VTLTLLAAGVFYSLWRTRTDAPTPSASEAGHPHEARAHRA